MRTLAILAALLAAGCFVHVPPRPQRQAPTYEELSWDDYCRTLRAEGTFDTPNHDCAKRYNDQQAADADYQDAMHAHKAAVERNRQISEGLSAAGDSMSGQPHVVCRSHVDQDGDSITTCH